MNTAYIFIQSVYVKQAFYPLKFQLMKLLFIRFDSTWRVLYNCKKLLGKHIPEQTHKGQNPWLYVYFEFLVSIVMKNRCWSERSAKLLLASFDSAWKALQNDIKIYKEKRWQQKISQHILLEVGDFVLFFIIIL